jgi:protein-disulfide isomerase-like protein with CxxC motif
MRKIAAALELRMRQGGPPVEIVLVLPKNSAGLKERISIGVYQAQILEHLTKVARQTGHPFGVYYQAAHGAANGDDHPCLSTPRCSPSTTASC